MIEPATRWSLTLFAVSDVSPKEPLAERNGSRPRIRVSLLTVGDSPTKSRLAADPIPATAAFGYAESRRERRARISARLAHRALDEQQFGSPLSRHIRILHNGRYNRTYSERHENTIFLLNATCIMVPPHRSFWYISNNNNKIYRIPSGRPEATTNAERSLHSPLIATAPANTTASRRTRFLYFSEPNGIESNTRIPT